MSFDTIVRRARLAEPAGEPEIVDIGILDGRIAALAPDLAGAGTEIDADEIDAGGRLVSPGLIETHIHLDKSRILDRCGPAPRHGRDHMQRVAAVKPGFTVEDVYRRARETLEGCILHGTMAMRSHVEVDPNAGLRGFEALQQLAEDYAWAIDLELCVFAQEGWSGLPETDANVVEGLKRGASVIGGAPSYDADRNWQIRRIFELAREFDVDIDIHLDTGLLGDLAPEDMDIHLVCELTDRIGWGGRVAVGHGTRYSSLPPNQLAALGRRMADAGVTLTVLPATDLFLMGRERDHRIERGVADANAMIAAGANCCLSSNNILNPFTPFGDGDLLRIANLYANTVQHGDDAALEECFAMLTRRPARLIGCTDYGLAVGDWADLVIWDASGPAEAVATVAPTLVGLKRGRRTFSRPLAELHRP